MSKLLIMSLVITEKEMTEQEYIKFEQDSEIRHEYINGKLINMPGESVYHNEVAFNITSAMKRLLSPKGYSVYMEDVKIKLPDENKYFYPDVFVTKEHKDHNSPYICYYPEIIFEVLSDSTRKYDMVDKFINYQKFNSLQYYILAEPEKTHIIVYARNNQSDWEADVYWEKKDRISLPALGIEVLAGDFYP